MSAMSLAALEILEAAQFAPLQARALVRVLETEAARREDLVTKSDLAPLQADIKATQADVVHLKMDFGRLEKSIKTELAHMATREDIERAKVEGARFVLLAMISLFGLIAGMMYFFLQYVR